MGQTGECLCSGICWDVLHRGTVSHEKLLYQLRQAVTVLCADDKVCFWQGSSLFRKCLCKASRQHHNGIRIFGTQAAECGMHAAVAGGGDGAGVDYADVAFLPERHKTHAFFFQFRRDYIRFILIHSTSESQYRGGYFCFFHVNTFKLYLNLLILSCKARFVKGRIKEKCKLSK